MSTPASTIYICSGVRLNNRYEHSIYFANMTAQESYFAGKVVKTFTAYTFLRKSWPIKVQATMEQAKRWSYLFFDNDTGKTYYYFINNVEYVNDNTVELSLELDVLQTYMFDYELLPSFIERQHVEDDTLFEHTVEEGLDVGEYTNTGRYQISPGEMCILIQSTIQPDGSTSDSIIPALPDKYNNVFSGVKIWAVDAVNWVALSEMLDTLSSEGLADSILNIWMYPKALVELAGEATWGEPGTTEDGRTESIILPVKGAVRALDHDLVKNAVEPPDALAGYTPKNNKLFCYPYSFLYVTNNQGNSSIYRYERMMDYPDMFFALSGALSPEAGVRMTPYRYNRLTYNFAEGMTLTGYPTCSWNSDNYKMWLAQNQNSQNLNVGTSLLKIAGGLGAAAVSALTGAGAVVGVPGGLTMAASGAMQIADQLAMKEDRAVEPPQAKGTFSTSVNITDAQHCFTAYQRTVTAETARIIDDYFTMYGYKLDVCQKPNIHAREAFTYVKTIGCHIEGEMCNEDTVQIESIFDHGITFWVNGDKICDYSQSNDTL